MIQAEIIICTDQTSSPIEAFGADATSQETIELILREFQDLRPELNSNGIDTQVYTDKINTAVTNWASLAPEQTKASAMDISRGLADVVLSVAKTVNSGTSISRGSILNLGALTNNCLDLLAFDDPSLVRKVDPGRFTHAGLDDASLRPQTNGDNGVSEEGVVDQNELVLRYLVDFKAVANASDGDLSGVPRWEVPTGPDGLRPSWAQTLIATGDRLLQEPEPSNA
ncbi:hypothetical protein BD324DRAFT_386418 [Kockovaella imperatae]|uniref:Uncharacterized protein n=1 Tax=Kockovaella imperatae TaxID=4999 RepID=A0A1Y1UJB0_9TREE|nr:hypothetical protein BD324DRAFT_386418 [Kockovaella imperatae]ORX37584.1 hypothetical protein BD324DRAFT_386418 [Kockovaella imperatae]